MSPEGALQIVGRTNDDGHGDAHCCLAMDLSQRQAVADIGLTCSATQCARVRLIDALASREVSPDGPPSSGTGG